MRVGIVGAGSMGTPMAKRLLRAGHEVVVHDLNRERLEHLADHGASTAEDVASLASQSEVVFTILTWPEVVEEVVLGQNGLIQAMPIGSILVEASSIDHATSIRIGERVIAAGRRYVECALIGRPYEIEDGNLMFLAAGEPQTIDACENLFADIGQDVLRAGDLGRAKLLKMVNAAVNATETVIAYEALRWCAENHVAQESFMQLMRILRPRRASTIDRTLGEGPDTHPSWTARDVDNCVAIGRERGVELPVFDTVHRLIETAQDGNAEGYSFSGMMMKYYESL